MWGRAQGKTFDVTHHAPFFRLRPPFLPFFSSTTKATLIHVTKSPNGARCKKNPLPPAGIRFRTCPASQTWADALVRLQGWRVTSKHLDCFPRLLQVTRFMESTALLFSRSSSPTSSSLQCTAFHGRQTYPGIAADVTSHIPKVPL